MSYRIRIFLSLVLLVACGDDDAGSDDAGLDGSQDASDDADASDGALDAGGCTMVNAVSWNVERDDDVSIAYEATLDAQIDGRTFGVLLLFERYNDQEYVGTFDLSQAPDDNFGTCAHCVYARSLTDRSLTFYVESGTLETGADPYGRVLNARSDGLRLVEVTVDPETRSSTPVPDGRCLEFGAFDVSEVFLEAGWTCDEALFGDGQCHCDCGAADPDCLGMFPNPPPEPVDCTAMEICGFNPVARSSLCLQRCDRAMANACGLSSTCIPDVSGQGIDRCTPTEDVISDVAIGDVCMGPPGLQLYCNIVDGNAQGYCDDTSGNVCQRLCESEADCAGTGFPCRTFAFDGDLGYCGPEPSDG